MPKSPAFSFYANDWLSSTKISLMSSEEEGAYIRLLCHEWNDPNCSLPDDDRQLAILCRLGEGRFASSSQTIRGCFVPHPKILGKIINVRLFSEWKKQEKFRREMKKSGLKSWQARKNKGKMTHSGWAKVGSQDVRKLGEGIAEGLTNSSSSSSSSSSEKEQELRPPIIPPPRPPPLESVGSWQKKPALKQQPSDDGFESFWREYPRKVGKGAAFQVWRKLRPGKELQEQICQAIKVQTASDHFRGNDGGQYVPNPKTWLNQERWKDELSKPETEAQARRRLFGETT